ncbi:hypothetical protein HK102_009906 [Quaeritorhiza haematococci]|nr:hypothetical protein HK102_009906 [Quaeritorhiza haematococci]
MKLLTTFALASSCVLVLQATTAAPITRELHIQLSFNKNQITLLTDDSRSTTPSDLTPAVSTISSLRSSKKLAHGGEEASSPLVRILSGEADDDDYHLQSHTDNVASKSVSKDLLEEIMTVGEEFQKLRDVRGHYEGGDWNEDVDGFNGRKHQLMLQLQQSLIGLRDVTLRQIHAVMGHPDARRHFVDASGGEEISPLNIGISCVSPSSHSPSSPSSSSSMKKTLSREDGVYHPLSKEDGVYHPSATPKKSSDGNVKTMCGDSYFELYLWRGWHDYLWVYVEGGEVTRNGWYHAWE